MNTYNVTLTLSNGNTMWWTGITDEDLDNSAINDAGALVLRFDGVRVVQAPGTWQVLVAERADV